jgi:ribosome-associated translation inhibitor RaiA
MQVQVNAGEGIAGSEALERWANEHLNESLGRFRQDITRIEVQLTDENSARGGSDDKRCLLEARLTGRDPIVAEHRAENLDMAVRGATQRLTSALDRALGKTDRKDRDTIRRSTDGAV